MKLIQNFTAVHLHKDNADILDTIGDLLKKEGDKLEKLFNSEEDKKLTKKIQKKIDQASVRRLSWPCSCLCSNPSLMMSGFLLRVSQQRQCRLLHNVRHKMTCRHLVKCAHKMIIMINSISVKSKQTWVQAFTLDWLRGTVVATVSRCLRGRGTRHARIREPQHARWCHVPFVSLRGKHRGFWRMCVRQMGGAILPKLHVLKWEAWWVESACGWSIGAGGKHGG